MNNTDYCKTWPQVLAKKQQGEKLVCLTAYDAAFAQLFIQSGVDFLLVGDSLGMVVQGEQSTLPVTVEQMVYHTQCVRKGAGDCFVISDLPFMSYHDLFQARENAAQLMAAGANMVKLEGAGSKIDVIESLTENGIPVCAHLGLIPQSIHELGGYKVQGRNEGGATQLLVDARTVEAAGAHMLVLECVPEKLGKQISEALQIPVIGIGAGVDCDGQVLVCYDMLGLNTGKLPKFVKNFMADASSVQDAVKAYSSAVKSSQFPDSNHSYL